MNQLESGTSSIVLTLPARGGGSAIARPGKEILREVVDEIDVPWRDLRRILRLGFAGERIVVVELPASSRTEDAWLTTRTSDDAGQDANGGYAALHAMVSWSCPVIRMPHLPANTSRVPSRLRASFHPEWRGERAVEPDSDADTRWPVPSS